MVEIAIDLMILISLGEKANSGNIAFHNVLHSIGEGFGVLGHIQIRGVIRRHKGRRLVIPI